MSLDGQIDIDYNSGILETGYGMDGRGIESRRECDFPYPFSPSLEVAQTPVQCVLCLFPGGVKRRGRGVDPTPPPTPNLAPRLKKE